MPLSVMSTPAGHLRCVSHEAHLQGQVEVGRPKGTPAGGVGFLKLLAIMLCWFTERSTQKRDITQTQEKLQKLTQTRNAYKLDQLALSGSFPQGPFGP